MARALRRDVLLALVGYGLGAVAGWLLFRRNEARLR